MQAIVSEGSFRQGYALPPSSRRTAYLNEIHHRWMKSLQHAMKSACGRLWSSFMQVISQSYRRGVSRSARKKGSARIDNPPVTACQPPLHKGALCGRFVNLPYVWLGKVRYTYVFNYNGAKRASHLTVQMLYWISPKAYYKQKEQTHRIKSCMSALFLLVLI